MLRKIRQTLALLFFVSITLLFLDFTGTIHAWLGWMAKVQFLPAVLALNVGVVVLLVALTLVLGRVYCSVICPLGVMQDLVSRVGSLGKKKKARFSYSPEKKVLRLTVLVLFIVALVAGVGSFVALLAPYSAYGRIVQNLFSPIYIGINNVLAYLAERADSYAFYETDVWLRSLPTFIVAAVSLVVITILAWRGCRTYCNTICPVGTVLGFLARHSLFKPVIDTDKCKNCSLCARKCKASCIDYKNHTIDYSRCVVCLDCLDNCKHNAIHYKMRRKKQADTTPKAEAPKTVDTARRSVLTATALTLASTALHATDKKVDGGLAVIEDKKIPARQTPILPAGAQSSRNFHQHCTACQLCVSVCPNEVLRPSTDLMTLMQPEMSYERGYCRPECNKCAEVCPAGAIKPISVADKSSTQIGHAVWIKQNCLPVSEGVECGNCARHCPAGAIQMIPLENGNPDSPKVPAVNTERCIGCGACENLCPVRPFSAIYVEGHEKHHTI